jgi:carbon-monoxide dehydrogenase medium subunit
MMLAEFELLMPKTLDEALCALADHGPETTLLAGGTNLVVDMRSGRHRPKVVINLDQLEELRGISCRDGYITIGSGVTIGELMEDRDIHRYAHAVCQAGLLFANPLIRNRATVGGNLADASPAADAAPPLMVMDAEVELASRDGGRIWVALDTFFTGVRKTVRKPDQVITKVRFPVPPDGSDTAYYKLGLRKADAISVVSAAVRIDRKADGVVELARIALGSVAPKPIRAYAAEQALAGQYMSPQVLEEASRLASEAVSPISDLRGSANYRRQMACVLVRRLLQQINSRPAGNTTEE